MRTITSVSGRGVPVRGNDIDTDRIMPARFLRAITFEGLEKHVFEDDRKGGGTHPYNRHPFDVSSFQGASVLVVNANFGCGSSREHAPQGLQRWGINAIVGESFAEIFFGNSAMIGLPCVTASPDDVRKLQDLIEKSPDTDVRIDLIAGTCAAGDLRMNVSIPPNVRDALVTGAWDTTGLLLDRYEEVDSASERLPYVPGFLKVREGHFGGAWPVRPALHEYFAFSGLGGRLGCGVLFFQEAEERRRRVRPLSGFAVDEPHLTTESNLRHGEGDEIAARDLGFGAAAWEQCNAHLHGHGSLDALEARQRDENVRGNVMLLEQPQHTVADVRRIVVRDHGLTRTFGECDFLAVGERV
jgi:3-isopropylmalate/(R)-2-methylmalate dehydratase small subunit